MRLRSAKDLAVYQKAYRLAMDVFKLSQVFPPEERYSLTSQVRRSSRSVCLNLREAWEKRRYEAHFISKLTDCDGENSETDSSLDFARDCGYIDAEHHDRLVTLNAEIGRMLGTMIKSPNPFLARDQRAEAGARDQRAEVGDQTPDGLTADRCLLTVAP